MRKRLRTAGRLAMVAALALLLTGCLKLDMDLQIQTDDTVNGSIIFAVSKDVLELTGGSAEDLLGGETPFPEDIQGVTSENYDDGDFAGKRFNFDGVPISQFSAAEDPESLSIVREGDTFKVSGVLDLSQGLSGATGAAGAEQFLESAEIRIAITFPGEVIDSNGQVDGNTVTWEPKFGDRLEIQATGSAIASGGDSNTLLYVLIGIGVLAVIAIVVAIVVMGRRKPQPEPAAVGGEMAAATPTEVMPPVQAPPAAPAPPVEAPPAPPPAPEPPATSPEAPITEPPPVPESEPPTAPETDTSEGEGEVPPPPPPTGQP